MTIPCANPNCPNTRSDESKYCSTTCMDAAHNDRKRARRKSVPKPAFYKVDHKPHPQRVENLHSVRRVMIVDVQCATPYYISKTELERNAGSYLEMDGLSIYVDGKPYEKQLVLI